MAEGVTSTGKWVATDDQKTVWLVGANYLAGGRAPRRALDSDTLAILPSLMSRAEMTLEPVETRVIRRGTAYRAYARAVRGPRGDVAGYVGYVQRDDGPPLEALPTGGWEWDIPNHQTRWTAETYSLYGEMRTAGQQSAHEWTQHLDPSEYFGQRRWWGENIEACAEDGALRTNTLRIVRVDNRADRVLAYAGRVLFDENGQPSRYRGFSIDVTEQVRTLNVPPTGPLLGALVTASRDLFFVVDLRWREVVYRSRDVEPFLGRALPRSGRLFHLLHPEDKGLVDERLTEFANLSPHAAASWTFRLEIPGGEPRTVTATVTPVEANPLTHEVDQILCCVQPPDEERRA